MHVIDNREKRRFEAEVEGHTVYIEYSVTPDAVSLDHTEVAKELGGKGIGSELVEAVLMQLELRGKKVIPACTFVKKYIEKHAEWASIVA